MTQMPSKAVLLTGTEEPPAEATTLTAGPVSAVFEDGALRTIAIGGVEAIRAIAFVVRDANWGTYAPSIENLMIEEEPGHFAVTYAARCGDRTQSLSYAVAITGRPDGVTFQVTGTPGGDFQTNRTGFAVLHPVDGVAGASATVRHTDGADEIAKFPGTIMPSQPFFDMAAITHEVAPGVSVTATLEGDAYEMEDQRNWTDASFKTYIRPLSRPFPYTLPGGERFDQQVSLAFHGTPPTATGGDAAITVTVGERVGTMPDLALALTGEGAAAALPVAQTIAKASVRSLVATYDGRATGNSAAMASIAAFAKATGASLTLEAILPLVDGAGDPTDDPAVLAHDVAALADAVRDGGVSLEAIVPLPACYLRSYQPSGPWPKAPHLTAVYEAVRKAFPGVAVVGGMHSYFTELNRRWPPLEAIDAITHSTTAIVHAADDVSVMETLEALPSVFSSVRAKAGDISYRVGPSAIGMRFNPYGAGTLPNPDGKRVAMAKADPRQFALFNAAWTLGYLARAAEGGVDSVCLHAPTGPFGLVHADGSGAPGWFGGRGASVYPAYCVVAGLAGLSGAPVRAATSSAPGTVLSLVVEEEEGPVLWLANLTAKTQSVKVKGFEGRMAAMLDEDSVVDACVDPFGWAADTTPLAAGPVALKPYAVVRITG
ncbi:MAG: hypothetical protein AAGD34_05555 [Pseudomonadota bacterium]